MTWPADRAKLGPSAMDRPFQILETGDCYFRWPDCDLACNFCLRGLEKRSEHGDEAALKAGGDGEPGRWAEWPPERVAETLREHLASRPASVEPGITLAGSDILNYAGLFELLAVAKEQGLPARLVTPGLRLADEEFTRRLAAFDVHVIVTFLSPQAETWQAVTGLPEGADRLQRGFAAAQKHGLKLSVQTVITRETVVDLLDAAKVVLDDFGFDAFTLQYYVVDCFFEEYPPDRWEHFVSFRQLSATLRELAQRYHRSRRRLPLVNIPPCKVDPQLLGADCFAFTPAGPPDPNLPRHRAPACEGCGWEPRCCFVTTYYQDRYPAEPFNVEAVNAWVDRRERRRRRR